MADSASCHNCNRPLTDAELPVTRHSNCPQCFHELHCCVMCSHYRPGDSRDCAEDRADAPVVKDSANFCEWFVLRTGAAGGQNLSDQPSASDNAQAALDALFDQPSDADAGSAADDSGAPRSLDDLFK